jgi:hypothetical protein
MAKDARKAEKSLRKHLKRLQGELSAASKSEAKRLRKLEKARWRRQRIEAFIDEVQAIAEVGAAATAAAPTPPTPQPGPSAKAVAEAEPAPGPAAPDAHRAKSAGRTARATGSAGPAPAPPASESGPSLRQRVWPPSRKNPASSGD